MRENITVKTEKNKAKKQIAGSDTDKKKYSCYQRLKSKGL